ncbi:MAG: helix-turn-helix domain-containing protein [Paludibacter sp.]|nr:helix-turn-helix domain-containing protein [Paludibacter sp.]
METRNPKAGASGFNVLSDQYLVNCNCKDIKNLYKTNILNNPDRKRILDLLLTGNPYSAIEISRKLGVHDPRSHIRYLKSIGLNVQSCWIPKGKTKFKVYFIQSGHSATTGKSLGGHQYER